MTTDPCSAPHRTANTAGESQAERCWAQVRMQEGFSQQLLCCRVGQDLVSARWAGPALPTLFASSSVMAAFYFILSSSPLRRCHFCLSSSCCFTAGLLSFTFELWSGLTWRYPHRGCQDLPEDLLWQKTPAPVSSGGGWWSCHAPPLSPIQKSGGCWMQAGETSLVMHKGFFLANLHLCLL